MNLYFLSLIESTKERKKNLCSIINIEGEDEGFKVFDDGLYFKNRFKLEDGDMVTFNGRQMVLHGEILGYSTNVFEVDDYKFHPFYWKETENSNFFFLSIFIKKRIIDSKMRRFRIGKRKYNLLCSIKHSLQSLCLDDFQKRTSIYVSDRDYDGTFEPQTLFLFS
jgi:hypothetical protein